MYTLLYFTMKHNILLTSCRTRLRKLGAVVDVRWDLRYVPRCLYHWKRWRIPTLKWVEYQLMLLQVGSDHNRHFWITVSLCSTTKIVLLDTTRQPHPLRWDNKGRWPHEEHKTHRMHDGSQTCKRVALKGPAFVADLRSTNFTRFIDLEVVSVRTVRPLQHTENSRGFPIRAHHPSSALIHIMF